MRRRAPAAVATRRAMRYGAGGRGADGCAAASAFTPGDYDTRGWSADENEDMDQQI